ncbi:hypothetical protein DSL92_06230 [Billgrantia gudaonensis]|uniref:Uncharacterized protein n=1 Tax=Billgrantia gudaonensis TaxID=376427 RepID=A0A432JIR6_9GAMM|nr:hypothetical protein DSL92_06230 [Halomonas gudaonensis]
MTKVFRMPAMTAPIRFYPPRTISSLSQGSPLRWIPPPPALFADTTLTAVLMRNLARMAYSATKIPMSVAHGRLPNRLTADISLVILYTVKSSKSPVMAMDDSWADGGVFSLEPTAAAGLFYALDNGGLGKVTFDATNSEYTLEHHASDGELDLAALNDGTITSPIAF